MTLPAITLLQGDCVRQIPTLKNRSIRAVVTSPPYADKRKLHYKSVPEKDYPEWMVSVCNAIRPKLTKDGSILINIRSHIKDGAVSDYVLRTRLALRKAGFIENEELIWHKPDATAMGSTLRPRRTWEQILWFSTCENPFCDLRALGRMSAAIGFGASAKAEQYTDLYHGATKKRTFGIARTPDVFTARIGDNSKHIKHSAAYSPNLAEQLIRTFSKEGDTILDPFAGTGTTLLVARLLNRPSVGVEFEPVNVELIRTRIKSINWKNAPHIPNQEWWLTKLQTALSNHRKAGGKTSKESVAEFFNATMLDDTHRWAVLDGVKVRK